MKVSQPTPGKPRQVMGRSLMGWGTGTGILLSFLKNAAHQRELAVLVNYLLVDTSVFRAQRPLGVQWLPCGKTSLITPSLCWSWLQWLCQDGCWAVFVYSGHKVTFFNAYKGIHWKLEINCQSYLKHSYAEECAQLKQRGKKQRKERGETLFQSG